MCCQRAIAFGAVPPCSGDSDSFPFHFPPIATDTRCGAHAQCERRVRVFQGDICSVSLCRLNSLICWSLLKTRGKLKSGLMVGQPGKLSVISDAQCLNLCYNPLQKRLSHKSPSMTSRIMFTKPAQRQKTECCASA